MISKSTKKENFAETVWQKEVNSLINNYFEDGGAYIPSEEINKLLSAYFSHQDRENLIADPKETANTVYTVTSLVTFIVKLNEYWAQLKKAKEPQDEV